MAWVRSYKEVIGRHYPMELVQVVALVEDRAKVEIEATGCVSRRDVMPNPSKLGPTGHSRQLHPRPSAPQDQQPEFLLEVSTTRISQCGGGVY